MSRKRRAAVAGMAGLCAAGAVGTGSAMAQDKGPLPKESHVTGDAWVKFPGDPEYPYRRFIVDAHGGPSGRARVGGLDRTSLTILAGRG